MAKMTTLAKLEAAKASVIKYKAQLIAESARSDLEVGDAVLFSHGRAETKKDLNGKVIGIKSDTNGLWVAVVVGEGFESETYKIRAATIINNATADARAEVKAKITLRKPE